MPKFLSNVEHDADIIDINGNSGTSGQVLSSLGVGNGVDWIDQTGGTSETAERIEVTVKNVSGGSLSKGTVVHSSPSANPPNGNVIEVIAADYDNSTKMPAIGILNETIANEAEGSAVMMGAVSGIDTSGFSIGDELYVGNLGAFTNSKPATAGQLIQKIAVVIKSHASNGLIKIFGAGRSNDVPLPLYIDNANQRVGISEPSPDYKLHVNGQIYSESDNYPVYYLKRNTSATGGSFSTLTGIASAFKLETDSSGTITDGFGGGIVFSIGDTFPNTAARIYARRDGGDQTGALQFWGGVDGETALMTLRASGNVGIGTESPAEKLVVSETRSGTTAADQTKYTLVSRSTVASGQTPGTGGIKVAYDDGTNEHGFGLVSGSSSADFLTTGPMHFYTNSDLNTHSATGFAMVIDNNQRVGIGTTSPATKLEVAGTDGNFQTTGHQIFLTKNGVNQIYTNSGASPDVSQLAFGTNNTERIRISSSGNVGIGTSNPVHLLQVGNGTTTKSISVSSGTQSSLYLTTPAATAQSVIGFGDSQYATINTRGRILYQNSTTAASNYMQFTVNFGEVMRLTDGNVGIGTTDPNAKLEVNDSANSLQMRVGSLTAGISPYIRLQGKNTANTTNYYADIALDAENGKLVFKDPGTSSGSIGQTPTTLDSSGNLSVGGNVEHNGLTMTSGTDIDQLKTVNMTFQLTADTWTDTGINYNDLSTGTYAVQVYVDDHNINGAHYDEYYSGMMSWYGTSTTNSTMVDEIPLHRAGHAPNTGDIQLRTQRHSVSAGVHLMLQVKHSRTYTAALDNTDSRRMTFKFRRLI